MQSKGKDGLTTKQRKYCHARASGIGQVESYEKAGYSMRQSKKSKEVNACKLESMEIIQKKLEELQTKADNGCILNTEQRKQALTEFYCDVTKSDKDRLKAIDLLNRMAGDYIDKKEINANINGLSRSDRLDAMQKTLDDLKTAWNASDREE